MNEIIRRLEDAILKSTNDSLLYSIFEGKLDLIKKHFKTSLSIFDALFNNKEIEIDKDRFYKDTLLILDIIKSFLIFSPINQKQSAFLRDYLEALLNINRGYIKDKGLERDILLAIRLLDLFITSSELAMVLKEWRLYLNQLLSVKPPAYKLAEHYLKVLEEDLSDQK